LAVVQLNWVACPASTAAGAADKVAVGVGESTVTVTFFDTVPPGPFAVAI